MKTRFLIPNQFKTLGWIIFIPSILISIFISVFEISADAYLKVNVFALYADEFLVNNKYLSVVENGIVDELLTICMVIGGIMIGFSKLKVEDEMIANIRYESLVWATYLNYSLILFFTIFIYGTSYLNVLLYNMFTLLLFFIIRFHYMIYKLNKTHQDD